MKLPAMDFDRALEINERIVRAYLARDIGCPVPDLSDVTIAEAVAATEIVGAHPGRREADGTTRIYVSVDVSRLPRMAHLFKRGGV